MSRTPLVFRTVHRIQFADLDLYNHLRTAAYATYFVEHRMEGVREHLGWDLKTIAELPFMVWVRRLEIDYVRPVRGEQSVTITSFVREFSGADALVECTMADANGTTLSRCMMTVAHVDRATLRSTPWPDEAIALFFERGE
jgi:acyl-CoA thioester hydrolase